MRSLRPDDQAALNYRRLNIKTDVNHAILFDGVNT